MTPLEEIMATSRPVIATGCRIWEGRVSADGVPVFGYLFDTPVTRYLTANRYGKRELVPVFSNKCANKLCINPYHLELIDWEPRESLDVA
ncbi:hypothetical protein [Streptomyces sp. SLBN-115]|uniref:hypothetical protein n=1 Tax=Streptomyces sp. SLBN-115 TaxID=2768453 RepID=UPI00114ED6DA|nr:hypothetical protein [Streptomyces sp. SLBN-115]TQJ56005.1 hypothetical protein FBY34_3820 [Streptomyces sp. SLBN-115]